MPEDFSGRYFDYAPIDEAAATTQQILLPRIYISEQLDAALNANSAKVRLCSRAIVDGCTDLGLSSDSTITLFAKDEHEGPIPEIEFMDPIRDRDSIHLSIDPSPTYDEESEALANQSFWLSVLLSNVLGRDETAMEALDQLRKGIRRSSLRTKLSGIGMTGAGVGMKMAMVSSKIFVPAAFLTGLNAIGFGVKMIGESRGRNLHKLHLHSEEFVDKIRGQLAAEAEELASEYSALEYRRVTP